MLCVSWEEDSSHHTTDRRTLRSRTTGTDLEMRYGRNDTLESFQWVEEIRSQRYRFLYVGYFRGRSVPTTLLIHSISYVTVQETVR